MDCERIIGTVSIADLLECFSVGPEGSIYVIETFVFALQRRLQASFDTPSYFLRTPGSRGRYIIAQSAQFQVAITQDEMQGCLYAAKKDARIADSALDELTDHIRAAMISYGKPLSLINPSADRRNDL
jgi:hypothetical protein